MNERMPRMRNRIAPLHSKAVKGKTSRTCSRGHTYHGGDPCPKCWPGYRRYSVRSKVWLYPGTEACWHFVTLPKKQSKEIRERFGNFKRGWGSLPVNVTIGKTTWSTSIFPDKKAGAYLLPLKAKVREAENIEVGASIALLVEINE